MILVTLLGRYLFILQVLKDKWKKKESKFLSSGNLLSALELKYIKS